MLSSSSWDREGDTLQIQISLINVNISSVQFSHSGMSYSLRPHGLQHTRPLSITNSQSLPKLMFIELVMPSNHLILSSHPHTVLLLPSIFPSIRVFSNESALCIRWPKYWSFSFSMSFQRTSRTDLLWDGLVGSPCSPRDSQESSVPQFKTINSSFGPQLSL